MAVELLTNAIGDAVSTAIPIRPSTSGNFYPCTVAVRGSNGGDTVRIEVSETCKADDWFLFPTATNPVVVASGGVVLYTIDKPIARLRAKATSGNGGTVTARLESGA